jgi:Domain of unknown function (DUF4917)
LKVGKVACSSRRDPAEDGNFPQNEICSITLWLSHARVRLMDPEVILFDVALKKAATKGCSLLLGNGFSAPYSSYKNLYEKADFAVGGGVRALFERLVNFEQVVKALEDASVVEAAYGRKDQSKVFTDDAVRVREGLVKAVKTAHPPYRDDIARVIPSCVEFLSSFGKVFTLNYDLLLYWVILGRQQFADGFGLGTESNGFRGPFKTSARCNIFHVHGGLHLFQTADYEIEKRLATAAGMIDAIAETISQGDRFPVYVAEGTSSAKMSRINAVPYLKHCYQQLYDCSGALFIYGHSASDNDAHIYNTVFTSGIDHIYFCIYKPGADSLAEMNAKLSYFQKSNRSRIGYTFVDAESAAAWE